MSDPAAYSWFGAYRDAILETDAARFSGRLDAAILSIKQRLCVAAPLNDVEKEEILNALSALQSLRAEGFAKARGAA
jgi:hypothetical protein